MKLGVVVMVFWYLLMSFVYSSVLCRKFIGVILISFVLKNIGIVKKFIMFMLWK